jgi:hypothetical protein
MFSIEFDGVIDGWLILGSDGGKALPFSYTTREQAEGDVALIHAAGF